MEKDFQIKLEETTLTVNLGVELSKINAPVLMQLLSTYQGQDIRKIVFDATDLVFISSAGIRCIIFARKDLGEKPEIVFVNCAKEIYEVFQIAGLFRFITFVDNDQKKFLQVDIADADMLHRKLATIRQQELDQFAASNDVVCYQLKLGEQE